MKNIGARRILAGLAALALALFGAVASQATYLPLTAVTVNGGNGTSAAAPTNPLPTTQANDVFVTQTVNLSSSAYSSGYSVGGLITISGLTPGAIYTIQYLHATITPAPSATLASVIADLFDASPSSSTFTDNAAAVLASADAAKRVVRANGNEVVPVTGETTYILYEFAATSAGIPGAGGTGSVPLSIQADASGNIYLAVITGTAFNALTSGKLILRADLRR